MTRFAVYAAPDPGSDLWRFGSGCIGYDSVAGADLPVLADLPVPAESWRDLTEEPRRYGFHATLKAPFGLGAGCRADDLLAAAKAFATAREPITIAELTPTLLGPFVALVPAVPSPAADTLAAACVEAFDPFRAPLGEADRARRLRTSLTPRQAAHLERWGYPYVFEDFRFHMTLTGSLPEALREPVRADLARRYRAVVPGLTLDAIQVCRQDTRNGRFRVLARLPFGR